MVDQDFPYLVRVLEGSQNIRGCCQFVPYGSKKLMMPTQLFSVRVSGLLDAPIFDWTDSPSEPGELRSVMESEAIIRLVEREEWMKSVTQLIDDAEIWSSELGWSTRRTEKSLVDGRFGTYRSPVLIMQVDTIRLMLEPIGSSAPEAGGIAELYRMPAYDDIARIVSDGSNWWMNPTDGMTSNPYEDVDPEEVAFSKDTLKQLAAGMLQNA